MSADVFNNTPRPTTSSTSNPTSTTPMSSSSTIASSPLISLSASLPLSIFSPPSPPSPTAIPTSTSSTMSTLTSIPPTTTTAIIPPSNTTISITITPTTIITTTTTIPPSIPTYTTSVLPTTTTTTVIPPTTSVTRTSLIPSSTLATLSTTAGTGSATTRVTTITSVISTAHSGSTTIITTTAEAMMSSTTPIAPVSTFSTTVYISTTDVRGSTTVYAPSFITTTATLMGPSGPTTTTAIIANPTLNVDNSSPSSFFQNKGAVAGVFTLVGLAVITITLWVFFFIRRRRREIRLEHDTAVSASLAAAGFNRTPLEDEYDSSLSSHRYDSGEFLAIPMAISHPERHRTSTSGLLQNNGGRLSILPDAYHEDRGQYDPYIQYAPRNPQGRYHDMPSPTSPHLNASPPSAYGPFKDRTSSDAVGMVEAGTGVPMSVGIAHTRHSHQSSGGSLEPLLASYQRKNSSPMPGHGGPFTPTVVTNFSNGRKSRTPSTENGSSASTSKPPYLQTQPNFWATNASSRSALLGNGREEQGLANGSEENLADTDVDTQKQDRDIIEDSEVSTAEDERELQKPVLAVRNLPDAASTPSLA